MCIRLTKRKPDYIQWEPAGPPSPVATEFYGKEDGGLPEDWEQKIRIYKALKCPASFLANIKKIVHAEHPSITLLDWWCKWWAPVETSNSFSPQLHQRDLQSKLALLQNFTSGSNHKADFKVYILLVNNVREISKKKCWDTKVKFSLPISLLFDELVEFLDAVPSVLLIIWISGLACRQSTTKTGLKLCATICNYMEMYTENELKKLQ